MSGKPLLEVTKSQHAGISKKPLPVSAACTTKASDLQKLAQKAVQTLILPSTYLFAPNGHQRKMTYLLL